MIFELIAAITAGFACGGIVFGLNKLTGSRLPRWIVPACAGLGMLAFGIWNDYNWFERTVTGAPEGFVVAQHNQNRNIWRPWSFAYPVVSRLVGVYSNSVERNENVPGQLTVVLALAQRFQQTVQVRVLFDCENHRRADLTGADVTVDENGNYVGLQWFDLPEDDPVLKTACAL